MESQAGSDPGPASPGTGVCEARRPPSRVAPGEAALASPAPARLARVTSLALGEGVGGFGECLVRSGINIPTGMIETETLKRYFLFFRAAENYPAHELKTKFMKSLSLAVFVYIACLSCYRNI